MNDRTHGADSAIDDPATEIHRRPVFGPYAMQKKGAIVILQFENAHYADAFWELHEPKAVNALMAAWPRYRDGTQLGGIEGWVVLSGGHEPHYRCWREGMSGWTDNLDAATRYARRQDAEDVHADDEDAWRVIPFAQAKAHLDEAAT